MKSTIDITKTVDKLVADIEAFSTRRDRFLDVGRLLKEFYDELPAELPRLRLLGRVAERTGICSRTAFHWIEISRAFSKRGIPRERLASIGWAKLSLLANCISGAELSEWIEAAENHTLSEMKFVLQGGKGSRRSLLFKVSSAEYTLILKALVSHGAIRSECGRQVRDKEQALVRICRSILDERTNTDPRTQCRTPESTPTR